MKRMGMVIGIKPDRIAEYKRTHAAVWPEVLAKKISACHIRNYTIFLRQPENLLFAYWEYRRRLGHRRKDDGGRCAHPGLVGDPRSDAGAARNAQGGRVVGDGGRGVPPRLRPARDPSGPSAGRRSASRGTDLDQERRAQRLAQSSRCASSARCWARATGGCGPRAPPSPPACRPASKIIVDREALREHRLDLLVTPGSGRTSSASRTAAARCGAMASRSCRLARRRAPPPRAGRPPAARAGAGAL